MKKLYLTGFVALTTLLASAQGTITMSTAAPSGTTIRILANVVSASQPITIDFGNGVEQNFTVDPSQMAYNRWIEGQVAGDYITIKGKLTELDLMEAQLTTVQIDGMSTLTKLNLSDNEIEEFEMLSITPLKTLRLSNNKIYNSPSSNPTLSLEMAGSTLTDLNLSHNPGLQCLDVRNLTNLEYLTLNNNPDMASLFICMPEATTHTALRNINLSDCNMSNFYPVHLPALRSLDLSNNNLMTVATDNPFVLGDYPNLTSLSVSGNRQVETLDLTKLPNLEQLWVNGCRFKMLDVSQNPELKILNCSDNEFRSLDLGNNHKITSLYIYGNPITELDVNQLPSIQNLNISNTYISRIDLMRAFYLKELSAANTLLEFVDFNGQQPNRMEKIDLRNCPNFTYESMAYTLHTLPVSKKVYSTNLWVEGSNAEHADIDLVTGADMGWMCDIQGDGTATHDPIAVTLQDATDTGENKTGVVDRLYPYMGYSMPYDLDVMQTAGGQFILAQWQPVWFQTVASVHDTALKGVPMYAYCYPEEGKRFKSVTVNGKEIFSPWFIVSEPSTIKVNFTSEMASVSFDVEPGHDFTFLANTTTEGGSIWVDWGTGNRMEYTGQNRYISGTSQIKGTRIDGSSAGNKITVYGDLAAIDVSGFGDMAEWFGLWDNHILGADLSNAPDLKFFSSYWNPISTIDLSHNTGLEVLNMSYNNLKTIDLSHNPNIMWLEMYSDGWGDPEDGISMLESIDVSNMPRLQYLDIKNNEISSIDLTQCPYLTWALMYGNELSSIDLSGNPILEELSIGANNLSAIDLSHNPALKELTVDNNPLTSVDVSENRVLTDLSLANCNVHALDLSANTALQRVWINGNGMTASELNDIYYKLPRRVDDGSGDQYKLSYNLAVIQGGDKAENDGLGADSSIAEFREWSVSHKGANNGCDVAYLDLIESPNGTYTITDEQGNVYTNGSKVPKYIPLTINCEPKEGYVFNTYSINGEEAIAESHFNMPGIFTRLMVSFRKGNGVDGIGADGVGLMAVRGGLFACAPDAMVSVYGLDGVVVANGVAVSGETFIPLTPGAYVARLKGNGANRTITFVVK